jgi:amicyanin
MKPMSPNLSPALFAFEIALLACCPTYVHAGETIAIVGNGSSELFRFDPANVTVKPGEEVTWVNKTNVEHSVTPATGFRKKLQGRDIEPSGTYSAVIKSGPIKYHCKYHPGMKANITVSTR